jgi:hypothetical protein
LFNGFSATSDVPPGNGKSAIRSALLIRRDDSALQVISKQLLLSSLIATDGNYMAIPDSWLIRPEHHRPQAIYQFREVSQTKKLPPKYTLTIPHHVNSKPNPKSPKIPTYKKGNWELIYVLKDNSKIVIHAASEGEANRVLTACKALVDRRYLTGSYLSKSGEVERKDGKKFDEIRVEPRVVKFWGEGRLKNKPDWQVKFD